MAIFAIAFTCTLASCSLFSGMFSDSKSGGSGTNKDYDFTAEATSGQVLCFKYLDSVNVSCVTPVSYRDPATKTYIKYQLSGNVVIPQKVSDGKKTYNVYAMDGGKYDRYGYGNKEFMSWGQECDIACLVIPPSVKKGNVSSRSSSLKNIIAYSSKETLAEPLKSIIDIGRSETVDCWVHVLRDSYNARITDESLQFVEIVDDYDIYQKGHSLDEYLKKAQTEIDQAIMMKKVQWRSQDHTYEPEFAVGNPKGVIMYYRFIDKAKKEVRFCGALDSSTESWYWKTFAIPSKVTYHNETYTVTSAAISSEIVAVPETCRDFYALSTKELICYSSDIALNGNYDIVHVPRGCVEKYMGNAKIACLEIVDNYSVYEDGHSIKEYVNMSRNAVETAKAAKIKAEEEAKVAQQKKEAAEKKAYRNQLAKKYGAKYVNALFDKGQITIGMPVELFDIGLNEHLYKNPRISYIELDGQTSRGACCRMYYISTNDFSSKFVGWIWFNNDKVAAVKY